MCSDCREILCAVACLLGLVIRSVVVELVLGRTYSEFGIADIVIALLCAGAVNAICNHFIKEDADDDHNSMGSP